MHKSRKKWKIFLAVTLLAVVCVAGAELAVCRAADPVLYRQITEPVIQTAQAAARTAAWAGQAAWDTVSAAGLRLWTETRQAAARGAEALKQKLEEWTAPPPEPQPEELVDVSALSQPDAPLPGDLLDPAISELVWREETEYLTGGGIDVVYYNQTDEAWANQAYGSDPIGTHACGPTAMAMAVDSLLGETANPVEMARLCVKKGYWCKNQGSYLTMVPGVAQAYGLACTSLDPATLDEDALFASLMDGDIVVALMGQGHFTKGGHFILLRGVTLEGQILVADPASRDRSLVAWDLSLIVEELSANRSSGSPLWLLSRPQESEFEGADLE